MLSITRLRLGILSLFLLFSANLLQAQSGCTDEAACNFDPIAVTDDGSCIQASGTIIDLVSSQGASGIGAPGGVMFDVTATNDLVVKSFYLSTYNQNITIYKKSTFGSHTTALEDPAQWEVVFSGTTPWNQAAYDFGFYYSESPALNVFIPAGQVQAFYIDYSGISNATTNQANVVATDGTMSIYGGTIFFAPFNTSGYGNASYAWSGAINYLAIVQACTDPAACNYNSAATCDDGSCILPDGCTDNTACNYNAAALCDDGSCIHPDGCTNPAACNYDAAAMCDDGSCNVLGNPEIFAVPANILACVGGDPVTIFGINFCPNSVVTIDGNPVFDLVITESTIDFTMPPGTGAVTLEVSGVNGTWMALLAYAPPAINGILNSTPYCGGETITIDGVNFCDAFEVNIAGQSASIISVDANSIVCTVPLPLASGDVPLIVTSPSGISFPVSINYGLVGCTNPSACNYDVTATCEDGSCILPDGCTNPAACNYDAAAVCDDGSCNVLGNPEIFAVPANTLACVGGDPVTIFGINFCPNSVVTIDGIPVFDLVITESTIDFTMPPGTGAVTLEVSGVNGTWMALLAYAPPAINGILNSTPYCGGETITIDGVNFCDAFEVNIAGQSASIISVDANSIVCTVPLPLASGDVPLFVTSPSGISFPVSINYGLVGCTNPSACNYDVTATCEDGSCVLPDGCTDPAACNYDAAAVCDDGSCNVLGNPEIFAVPANTLACIGGDPVTIFGINFCPNSVVTIDGNPVTNLVVTETTLDFLMPPGTGAVTLEVSGVNGTWMAFLTYAPPVINSSSIAFSCFGGETVTIFGNNLCEVTSVEVGGQSAAIISSDANSVEFTVPAPLSSGDVSIIVITPSGISNSILFNYGVTGCTDPASCNYNALVTCDDGSCTYPGCFYPEACNYNPSASCDDGSCEFTSCSGCTEATACNYDLNATLNDGSCEYTSCAVSGCTYPDSPEYNPSATTDNGTCTFTGVNDCPGDLNNDGIVNTGDLNALLGVYGLSCP